MPLTADDMWILDSPIDSSSSVDMYRGAYWYLGLRHSRATEASILPVLSKRSTKDCMTLCTSSTMALISGTEFITLCASATISEVMC